MIPVNSREELEQLVQANPAAVIDFWAVWCGPCRMMAVVLERLSEKHPEIVIGKIDVDKHRELAIDMEIQAMPTLVFYRDGVEYRRHVGVMTLEDLVAALGVSDD
jgi:thioredoxin